MTYDLLMYCVTAVYLVQVSVFLAGLRKRNPKLSTATPFVSVIIAARNEESNIGSCLRSVCTQSYPSVNYEVLLVDDHSEDRTRDIAATMAQEHS
ncbi:MAG: glycosyltransferase, partial [Bacteroidota bacterium]